MAPWRVFRVILPVGDIEQATAFYQRLLAADGERVTSGRHYLDCDGFLLACWDALAAGDPALPGPNPGHVYLATNESLEAVRQRAVDAGAAAAISIGPPGSSARIDHASCSRLHESAFVCEHDCLHSVANVQLAEHSRHVSLDRRLAEVELPADLGVRQTAGE